MGELMRDASFSLAAAKYAAGEFAPTVRESASVASIKVRMATENAMGVRLPVFEKTQDNVAGMIFFFFFVLWASPSMGF